MQKSLKPPCFIVEAHCTGHGSMFLLHPSWKPYAEPLQANHN